MPVACSRPVSHFRSDFSEVELSSFSFISTFPFISQRRRWQGSPPPQSISKSLQSIICWTLNSASRPVFNAAIDLMVSIIPNAKQLPNEPWFLTFVITSLLRLSHKIFESKVLFWEKRQLTNRLSKEFSMISISTLFRSWRRTFSTLFLFVFLLFSPKLFYRPRNEILFQWFSEEMKTRSRVLIHPCCSVDSAHRAHQLNQ